MVKLGTSLITDLLTNYITKIQDGKHILASYADFLLACHAISLRDKPKESLHRRLLYLIYFYILASGNWISLLLFSVVVKLGDFFAFYRIMRLCIQLYCKNPHVIYPLRKFICLPSNGTIRFVYWTKIVINEQYALFILTWQKVGIRNPVGKNPESNT